MLVYSSSLPSVLTVTDPLAPHNPGQSANVSQSPLHLNMADQPALGPDGHLLDATDIEWYNDPDDAQPIQPTPCMQEGAVFRHVTVGDY